jgi:myo-inositol-1(or 4)-monophosphatase
MQHRRASDLYTALAGLLREAGQAAWASRSGGARRKADGSEVTEADLRSEEILLAGLSRLFPRDALVSEEGGGEAEAAGTWYVDPLDGTAAFLEGLAHWGPTLCRVVDGRFVAGALYLPRLDEFFFAELGGGAWLDGERLQAGDPGRVSRWDALCVPSRFHRRGPFPWNGRVRALGSTAVHLAQVARGAALGALVFAREPWDLGAGALLVQEAGREVLWTDGRPVLGPGPGPLPVLAGAPTALRSLLPEVQALVGFAGPARTTYPPT